ncbi:G patch domain-containing protein 4 [Melipona quadrifasciata]|uniref:G patch domain-containing protein 4 n=1 Tax=Melipona quadrifasciata TaxID=166423 RepID=A0A0M9AAG0_9HYME|nr:G patch domain-containing protein 4 [Melipona quadrifasciata]
MDKLTNLDTNDFSKSLLMKYGWREGKGLGKHENGITEALKPKLKFDTAGIGHKDKEGDNWWEHAFNKAANSIKVVPNADGVSISVSKEDATNDLTEDLAKRESKYGNFVKSFTLFDSNVLIKDNTNAYKEQDTEKNTNHVSLTDEELYKIHHDRSTYGARYGLTSCGKLKRIAQQDKYLLSTDLYTNISTKLQNSNTILHDNEYKEINDENIMLPMTSPENETDSKVYKTITKKDKKRMNDLSRQLNVLCNISDSNEKNIYAIPYHKKRLGQENKEKKKKKRKRERERKEMSYDTESFEKDEIDNISTVSPSKSMKKKAIKKHVQNQADDDMEDKHIDMKKKKRKKKKFKKEKNEINQYENIINTWEDDELYGSQAKKFKRSHKSDLDIHLIKNEDIKTEDKFQAEFSGNKISVEPYNVTCPPLNVAKSLLDKLNTHLKKKIDHLNAKIKKKKLSKIRKKKKIELDKIAKSLKAIHFSTEEPVKKKSIKNELKAVTRNMMMMNVTIDKTESLKKKKKKTKKKDK